MTEHAQVQRGRTSPFPERWGTPPVEEAARYGWVKANAFADMIEKRYRVKRSPRRLLLDLRRRRWEW